MSSCFTSFPSEHRYIVFQVLRCWKLWNGHWGHCAFASCCLRFQTKPLPGKPSSPKNRLHLYPNVAHNSSTVAHHYRPLAFQVRTVHLARAMRVPCGLKRRRLRVRWQRLLQAQADGLQMDPKVPGTPFPGLYQDSRIHGTFA